MESPKKVDTFHILLTHETSATKLEIPSAAGHQMQEARLKKVFLREVRIRNAWAVDLAKVGDSYYFQDGWMSFYKDHLLNMGDLILFKHKGDNLFEFEIFMQKECADIGGVKKEQDQEEVEDEDDVICDDDGDNDDGDDNAEDDGAGGDDNDNKIDLDDDVVVLDDDDDDDDDDGDNDAGILVVYGDNDDGDHKAEDDGAGGDDNDNEIDLDDDVVVLDDDDVVDTHGARTKRRRKSAFDCYRSDIFNSGLIPRPQNPYFVTKPTRRGKHEMYIPRDVIVDHFIEIPDKLVLVDEQSRRWDAKIKRWKDGRVFCYRGWKSLCKANAIELDDLCICEFVLEEENKNLCIKVHVVPK